jgi:hypothetical protein
VAAEESGERGLIVVRGEALQQVGIRLVIQGVLTREFAEVAYQEVRR